MVAYNRQELESLVKPMFIGEFGLLCLTDLSPSLKTGHHKKMFGGFVPAIGGDETDREINEKMTEIDNVKVKVHKNNNGEEKTSNQ